MNPRHLPLLMTALGFALIAGPRVNGAGADAVKDDQFATLQLGELENVAITSDGYLMPSYGRDEAGDTGAEIVWSALDLGGKRGILCATGHEGKLVRLVKEEAPQIVADLPEPELAAMLRLSDGNVLVAASPGGRIYQLGTDDKLTTLTTINAKFIWDLEEDAKGNVWAAAGDGGKLFKITRDKKGAVAEEAFDSESKNLIDVWADRGGLMGPKGCLYLAGQNPGWLYRFDPSKGEGGVIFNAESDEIRAIQPVAEGLALALNSERAPTAQALTLTLRMAGGGVANPEAAAEETQQSQQPPEGGAPKADPRAMGDVFTTSGKPGPYGPVSLVMLLTPEGFTRPLWMSPEKPIHSLGVAPGGNVLVAAGGKGRLFEILPNDSFALVSDLKEDYLVRIVPAGEGWLLAAARNGVVFRMGRGRSGDAVYRSRVFDMKTPVKWGQFYWSGETGKGQKVEAAYRTGATDDPEKGGWSEWTKAARTEKNQPAALPPGPARYLQYKLTFDAAGASDASLRSDYVEFFHTQPNRAPRVKKITVADSGTRPAAQGGSQPSGSSGGEGQSGGQAASGGQSGAQASTGGEAAGGSKPPETNSKSLNVTWQAEDPNGDALQYALYYKADDEADWKLIQDELTAPRMALTVGGVADGRYRFKVAASDALANPPGTGMSAELVSDEAIVDNTPPRIEGLKASAKGDRAEISLTVTDDLSVIASVTFDWDGGDSYPIPPADGIHDQASEKIEWSTPRLPAGEHVLTVNASDRRGNMMAAKIVFRTGE